MDRLKNNWKWKLASLIIGFFLWSYITAGVNPTQELTLRDIPLEMRNQQSLTQNDYTITAQDPQNLSVLVTGKRNQLGDLQPNDIVAVVDLSNFEEGMQSFPIRYESPSDIIITQTSAERVNLTIEKVVTRSVNVNVEDLGQLDDNYILESLTATPQTVEITGSRSKVDAVERLVARIDITGLTEDRSSNVKIVPVNAAGEEVPDVTLSLSSVNVSLSILKQKEVGIVPNLRGELADDSALRLVQVVPNTILVKGKTSVIDNLETMNTEPIDQAQITEDIERSVHLDFPDGVESVNGNSSVNLKIDLDKKEDRVFDIPANRVAIENGPVGTLTALQNPDATIDVTVNGFPSDLDNLSPLQIRLLVDLADSTQTAGTISRPLTVELPEGFTLVSTSPRAVSIILGNEESDEEPPEESSQSSESSANNP